MLYHNIMRIFLQIKHCKFKESDFKYGEILLHTLSPYWRTYCKWIGSSFHWRSKHQQRTTINLVLDAVDGYTAIPPRRSINAFSCRTLGSLGFINPIVLLWCSTLYNTTHMYISQHFWVISIFLEYVLYWSLMLENQK